ncbi:uncharacterized protein LOC129892594 [Solanum dulcamara]|uniref:uncharacterized protein LOC129892594 n=1 Tax=Solanum dulcamara TaxID=45834 RepID=UPI002484F4B0|nr:uncharacterized protein LOC129892594 [Solanum dulcamara]
MKTEVVVNVSVNGCQARPSMKNFIVGCLKPMVPCLFQDATCKNKVMTIAATLPRVENISLDAEKNLLTVIGEGIDTVELVNILRKKVGFAIIVSQGPQKVEKKNEDKTVKEEKVINSCDCINNNSVIPVVEIWEARDPSYSCNPFWW